MPPKQLLDSDSDGSDNEVDFKINEQYAKKHQHQQELAERFRLEAKYGKDATAADAEADESSDSEADVTEDEDGEQVTADIDAAILRTLIKIRKGDKDVYDPSVRLFDRERQALGPAPQLSQPTKSDKKLTLSDFQRQRFQELAKDDEHAAERLADATTVPRKRLGDLDEPAQSQPKTHAQEEEDLRRETLAAFHADDNDDEKESSADEDGGLFTKKSEDAGGSYRDYLLQALGGDHAAVDEVLRERASEANKVIVDDQLPTGDNQPQKEAPDAGPSQPKSKSKEEQDQEFLMNYILNRGWMDQAEAEAEPKRDWDAEAAELESDASFASHADEWENEFNLRYENQDPHTVPTFSRDAAAVQSVRREDNKRKRQREERKARKDAEKQERMQEIERLQHLKRKDILERVAQLRKVTGNQNLGEKDLDLEGEFDPDAHDKSMNKAFDDSYYEAPEDADDEGMRFDADGKPVWDDDLDISDILKEEEAYEKEHTTSKERRAKAKAEKAQKKNKTAAPEQDGQEDDSRIEMDADYLDGQEAPQVDESKLSKKERKKLKKKAKKDAEHASKRGTQTIAEDDQGVDVDEMDADTAPVKPAPTNKQDLSQLPPEERKKAISRMLDEYYQTGAEDMIGDMPTRFKYTQVPKASYGMSPVEILLADDKDLNEVVGVKHLQPYRREIGKPTKPHFLSKKVKGFRQKLASRYDDGSGLSSAYASKVGTPADGGEDGEKKKRKGKKQREMEKKRKAEEDAGDQPRSEKKSKH